MIEASQHPVADEQSLREGGDLLSVPGIRGAAVTTGVKPSGKPDLALIVADEPQRCAAMFTTCAAAAAPVVIGRQQLAEDPRCQSIVINSGNANALTGSQGLRDALRMRVEAATVGSPAWVMSTGVIGHPLPMNQVVAGIHEAGASLTREAGTGSAVADAILTTDTRRKVAATKVGRWTVGGMAKGSGMIHPDMATMLAVIATDAPISLDLQAVLGRAVDHSFHTITVDGDTSTNDTVMLLAPPVKQKLHPEEERAVVDAIQRVARSLALQIVEDGEGASRLLEITIEGAPTPTDARTIGRSIACSSLVKTALAGGDPNWGRILAAAGNSGVPLDPQDWRLWIGDHLVFRSGAPTASDTEAVEAAFSQARVRLRLRVGQGPGRSQVVTTDLTHDYVTINAEYTT